MTPVSTWLETSLQYVTSVIADVIDTQHGDVVRKAHTFTQVWWQCHACGQHGIGRLSVRHFDLPDVCTVCRWPELQVSIKERSSGEVFVSDYEVNEVEDASLDI